jgi:hypothetical protein
LRLFFAIFQETYGVIQILRREYQHPTGRQIRVPLAFLRFDDGELRVHRQSPEASRRVAQLKEEDSSVIPVSVVTGITLE